MTRRWSSLEPAEREQIYSCKVAELPALAEQLGCSYATALLQHSKRLAPIVAGKTPILCPGPAWTGNALIISDVHIPRHDASFCNAVLGLAASWGLGRCIIGGDLLDADMIAPFDHELPPPTTEEELDAGAEFLGRLAQQFFNVEWLTGNHDARLIKLSLRMGFGPDRIRRAMGTTDRIKMYPYHWGDLTSGGVRWRIEHPKNASITPGAVGTKLAAKYLVNVIIAHGHTIGYQRDMSGRYTVIDSGGLFGLDRLPYVSLEHSTRPAMNQGAVIVKNGIGYLIDPLNCDWDAMAYLGKRITR